MDPNLNGNDGPFELVDRPLLEVVWKLGFDFEVFDHQLLAAVAARPLAPCSRRQLTFPEQTVASTAPRQTRQGGKVRPFPRFFALFFSNPRPYFRVLTQAN